MKKRFFAVLTVLSACLLVLAGCQAKPTEKPQEPSTEELSGSAAAAVGETQPKTGLALIGGGMEYVREQNRLTKLLKNADSITVRWRTPDGEYGSYSTYFLVDNEVAVLSCDAEESAEPILAGRYKQYSLYVSGDHVVAQLYIPDYLAGITPSCDDELADYIASSGEVQSVTDNGDTVEVTVCREETQDGEAYRNTYLLEKETLRLMKATLRQGDGTVSYEITVEQGAAIDPSPYVKAWETTRQVTFCYLSEGGEDQVVTVEVPATWEVQPQYNSTPNLYLDRDLTIPYQYPGDGESYTIYASDAEG